MDSGSGRTAGVLLAHAGTMVVAGQVLLFYSFVWRAALHLGRWPSPYQPDPKDLGFTLHHAAVWVGLFAVFLSPLAAVIGYYASVELWASARVRAIAVATYLLACGAGAALILADPGAFGAWFAD